LLDQSPALPLGLRYQPALIPTEEERELVGQLAALPFRAFEFQGYLGKRRVLSFGWQYDFNAMQVQQNPRTCPRFCWTCANASPCSLGLLRLICSRFF